MKLILSTLTSPQRVVFTKDMPNKTKQIVKTIIINGGANVVQKKTLVTPKGVVTELTDEDWELLKNSEWYKRQNEGGFIRPVEDAKESEDPKKKGMNSKDKSAQKTSEDFKNSTLKVRTGKPSEDKD